MAGHMGGVHDDRSPGEEQVQPVVPGQLGQQVDLRPGAGDPGAVAPGVEPGDGPQGERSRDPQDGTDGSPVPGTPVATALPHAVGQQDQRDHQGLLEER